jgi:hypothetical protein
MKLTVNLKTGVSYKMENVTEIHHGPICLNTISVQNDRFEEYLGENGIETEKFYDHTSLFMDEITSIVVEN